jgi:hypothetical protein
MTLPTVLAALAVLPTTHSLRNVAAADAARAV